MLMVWWLLLFWHKICEGENKIPGVSGLVNKTDFNGKTAKAILLNKTMYYNKNYMSFGKIIYYEEKVIEFKLLSQCS